LIIRAKVVLIKEYTSNWNSFTKLLKFSKTESALYFEKGKQMKIPIYQIDAFTNSVFSGNPAAVCPLNEWLEDRSLQLIAAENNLSETAFFVKQKNCYELRWFTPTMEVDLCGHATLASAFVIFNHLDSSLNEISFKTTKAGTLIVKRENDLIAMDFPSRKAQPCKTSNVLIQAFRITPSEVLLARDYLVVFESEEQIKLLKPDMNRIMLLDSLGVIVTAPGKKSDFVSRFFAPKAGIPEDPVTGSAHSTLIPYWSERLNKKSTHAFQFSQRGGELFCEDLGERVKIAGKAVSYLEGAIYL
jgi:PhzF family phenazine biosynthesis protein